MNKKGISLLENLVAVVILIFIVFGMVGIFISGRQHIGHSRSLISAAELGRYYLDPLLLQVRQDQWGGNCLGTLNGTLCQSDGALQPLNLNGILYTPQFVIDNAPPGSTTVRRVKLTVTWNEPS